MYSAKGNNIWYNEKLLGIPQYFFPDKLFTGWVIGVGLLAIIVGPLWFFSTAGGFVAFNPVTAGSLKISLVITKSIDQDALARLTPGDESTWSGPPSAGEHQQSDCPDTQQGEGGSSTTPDHCHNQAHQNNKKAADGRRNAKKTS
jgi:hypothetical protein